jgi:hypothetical protein
MTPSQFAVALGIFSPEEVDSPFFSDALTSFPFSAHDFWNSIATLDRGRAARRIECVGDPLVRYIFKVLSEMIRGRANEYNGATNTDLLHLYSIFQSVPCNIAYSLIQYFSYYQRRVPSYLMGGSFITRLARSRGLLTDQTLLMLSPPRFPDFVKFNEVVVVGPAAPIFPAMMFQQDDPFELTPLSPCNFSQLLASCDIGSPSGFSLLRPFQPTTFYQQTTSRPGSPYSEMGLASSGKRRMLDDLDVSSPPVYQQSPQDQAHQRRQCLPYDEAGPSTTPPANDPPVTMDPVLDRLEKQVRRVTRQNQWLIQSLMEIADALSVKLSCNLEDELIRD